MAKTKEIRTAELGITDELKKMKVGEIVYFPIPKYNYNSIRSTPSTLIEERCKGMKWATRVDYDNRRVIVRRIS